MRTSYTQRKLTCGMCKATDLEVVYNMPFHPGHWAYVCENCRKWADSPNTSVGTKLVKGEHPKAAMYNLSPEQKRLEMNKHAKSLSKEEMAEMVLDSVVETADGCLVEPDGECPHGYKSPITILLKLGII